MDAMKANIHAILKKSLSIYAPFIRSILHILLKVPKMRGTISPKLVARIADECRNFETGSLLL
jgi:hypothetical protein